MKLPLCDGNGLVIGGLWFSSNLIMKWRKVVSWYDHHYSLERKPCSYNISAMRLLNQCEMALSPSAIYTLRVKFNSSWKYNIQWLSSHFSIVKRREDIRYNEIDKALSRTICASSCNSTRKNDNITGIRVAQNKISPNKHLGIVS